MKEAKHTTGWEDGGIANVWCDGEMTDLILEAESPPKQCPKCGAQLVLRWKVRIEEAT